jgi:CheY-like chemotaxis protein
MSQMSGVQVLQKLRSHDHTQRLPVIVLTGAVTDPDLTQATRLGANGHVIKPLEFPTLVEVVSSLRIEIALHNRPPNVLD